MTNYVLNSFLMVILVSSSLSHPVGLLKLALSGSILRIPVDSCFPSLLLEIVRFHVCYSVLCNSNLKLLHFQYCISLSIVTAVPISASLLGSTTRRMISIWKPFENHSEVHPYNLVLDDLVIHIESNSAQQGFVCAPHHSPSQDHLSNTKRSQGEV